MLSLSLPVDENQFPPKQFKQTKRQQLEESKASFFHLTFRYAGDKKLFLGAIDQYMFGIIATQQLVHPPKAITLKMEEKKS